MNAEETEQLIDSYGTDVYRFCVKLTGSKSDAEDLYQQTFLRIVEIGIGVEWDRNPKAFLFSITNGIWKNDIKKQTRHMRIAPSVTIDEDNENLLVDSTDVEKEVFSNIEKDQMYKIIKSLHSKFQVPIILYYTFDMALEEISKILQVPAGTVKSRLYKGRKLIKEGLEARCYEESFR